MVRSFKRQTEPAYDIVDDGSAKIFESPPDKAIRQDFLLHVKDYGTPHGWRFHSHSPPPKNSKPKILEEFEIPLSFRKRILMAPCPMCSPRYPKYWSGMLAWFPEDNALRAIGNECGHEYLGDEAFKQAIDRFRKDKEFDHHFDFLLNNMPKVKIANQLVSDMFARAKMLDLTRAALKRSMSRVLSKNIHRQAIEKRSLILYNNRKVPVVGPAGEFKIGEDGNVIMRNISEEAERYPFNGSETLLDVNKSASADLITAEALLRGLNASSEEEIISVLSELHNDQIGEPVFRIQKAWGMVTGVILQFEQTREFFQPSNVENLNKWGRDLRCPLPVRCRYDRQKRFEIGEIGKKLSTIPIHGSLLENVPRITPLE